MENTAISLEAGPPEHLDQGFQLDFKSNDELEGFETEGFDFGLDRSYEEAEHVLTEQNPDDAYEQVEQILTGEVTDAAAADADAELDLTDPEVHPATAGDEQVQTTEVAEDTKSDVGYQDEIGYEDEDHLTTDVNADLSITEAGETESGLPEYLPEDHHESAPQVDDSLPEMSLQDNDASWDQEIDFGEHDESTKPQDSLGNANEAESSERQEGEDLTVDDETAHEQVATDRHDVDLEEELENLAHSISEVPDIEVLYNQECYSLFGTPGDDPDSYFLSDVEELNRPLSQLLSALRAVISDDVAPTDELVIRFDPLDLEFGERSNEKFLNRSFREILDCHLTLRRVPGVSTDPVIHLTVRRDSEDHFLEILADAERVKDSPSSAEDSEMSENLDEGDRTNPVGDEQVQDGVSENANLDEYQGEGEHAAADHFQSELEAALGHEDVAEEHEYGHAAPNAAGQAFDGEENFEDTLVEANSHEFAEAGAVEEQAWEEQTENDANVPQHSEASPEAAGGHDHQTLERHDDSGSAETADLNAVDGVAASDDREPKHEAGANDDDLILAFDDEPGLSTIREEGDEFDEYTITYDAADNTVNDAGITQELEDTAATSNESVGKHSELGASVGAVAETASVHTSTTINGDEIDYDEEETADDTFAPVDNSAHESLSASGAGHDEIDWENDEDEDEEQPANEDAGAEYEESTEPAPTPPSVSGKRSRTDETESLADETDHKRRRT